MCGTPCVVRSTSTCDASTGAECAGACAVAANGNTAATNRARRNKVFGDTESPNGSQLLRYALARTDRRVRARSSKRLRSTPDQHAHSPTEVRAMIKVSVFYPNRSEEHTSELQSPVHRVCR